MTEVVGFFSLQVSFVGTLPVRVWEGEGVRCCQVASSKEGAIKRRPCFPICIPRVASQLVSTDKSYNARTLLISPDPRIRLFPLPFLPPSLPGLVQRLKSSPRPTALINGLFITATMQENASMQKYAEKCRKTRDCNLMRGNAGRIIPSESMAPAANQATSPLDF